MLKKIIIAFCIISFGINLHCARAGEEHMVRNWGESVYGVQLAIVTTNTVFQVGSSYEVMAVTRNSSNSIVVLDDSAPTLNFDLSLTGENGAVYKITTRKALRTPRKLVELATGKENVQSVPVTFGREIEPGHYSLKARRKVTMNEREYTIESNSIKVEVVK